jgi:outer membrane lipoprotein-sorting protein
VRLNILTKRSWLAAQWGVLGLVFTVLLVPSGMAQNPETLMPEASAAKAKEVIQDLINGLGGNAYLEVQESECAGRRASFGHNGELTGYSNFKVYWRYPDKNRTDFSKKGVIINLYNGDKGWTLDRGGVTELSPVAVADFQEQTKRDINNLLRVRLKEPGMLIRYGGIDIVDLKTVEWVDITDSEQRNFRLAVDKSSHLLARSMVTIDDPDTHEHDVETYIYTNYQLMDSVWTPLQITLDRNGRRINQVFYQSCKFNPQLPGDMFTRAALDKRFSEVGSKKYKAEKKKEKEEDNN